MSANAEVLHQSDLMGSSVQEAVLKQYQAPPRTADWNPAEFAREQIRGLVRRVFFSADAQPVKQVVISAAEAHIEVSAICEQVGRALALETDADVAIVGQNLHDAQIATLHANRYTGVSAIKSQSTRTTGNLWRVSEFCLRERGKELGTGHYWLSRLSELRNEFEYCVIQGPTPGISNETAVLGELADGIILVLDAHSTRRVTARKIKESLESGRSRILGTVLSGRTFPVPDCLYRRL